MRVGVFTPLLSQYPLELVLKKLAQLHIDTVELGAGNYVGDAHCKISMLEDASALSDFKKLIADRGFSISALSCHGNALHPNKALAHQHREVSRKTILLAEKLEVPVIVDFSGCPGDSPKANVPNWVTCPWPPDFRSTLEWQWNEVVAPYWIEHARFAADHGVKIAVEMHPGFVVYNPETLLRLRSITGDPVGCNYDPSHLFWQNIDPIEATRVLGKAILHVHAKDTQLCPMNMVRTGMLDTKPYTQELDRSWIFRTCGYGHGAEWWSAFISALRLVGYDSVLSIEHEDSLMSPAEGLTKAATFLNRIIIREQPAAAWWS